MVGANGDELILDTFKNVKRPVLNFLIELYCINTVSQDDVMETPPTETIYHIARDGKVIGAFSFPAIAEKFKNGSVKPSDHYLIEGTNDWKLIEELKSQFAEHERKLKAEVDRKAAETKAAKEAEAAKAKAAKEEAEQIRLEQAAMEATRKRAQAIKSNTWKCHTCDSEFVASEKTPTKTEGERSIWAILLSPGIRQVIWLVVLSVFLGALVLVALFTATGQGKFALVFLFALGSFVALTAAIGQLIAYGAETALKRVHALRRRCPKCSSPYCSNQAD